MSDEHDDDTGGDGGSSGGFWGQVPSWLKVLAAVIGGTAAVLTAGSQLMTSLRPAKAGASSHPPDTRYIVIPTNDHFLALRDRPTASSNLIIKMNQGTVVNCEAVLDDHPSWRPCSFAGHNGYANTTWLRKLEG